MDKKNTMLQSTQHPCVAQITDKQLPVKLNELSEEDLELIVGGTGYSLNPTADQFMIQHAPEREISPPSIVSIHRR